MELVLPPLPFPASGSDTAACLLSPGEVGEYCRRRTLVAHKWNKGNGKEPYLVYIKALRAGKLSRLIYHP